MKPTTKILTLTVVLIFNFQLSIFNCVAQLDTVHWIPPLHAGISSQIQDHYVYLSTPITTPFTVTIKNGAGTILATPTISNTAPFAYFVGTGQTSGSPLFIPQASLNTVLTTSGLTLTATQPFYVTLRARSSNQADWATSKGKAGLGNTFRFGAFPQVNGGVFPFPGTPANRNFTMGIMATQNNTTITVSGYNPAITFDGVPLLSAPPSFTILLNQGECYVVAGGVNFAPNRSGFMGALIQADKPIALNNGNMNGTIHPTNTMNQDMGIDLSIPVERLGKDYIIVEGNGNPIMENPIVIAHFNNTAIFINGATIPITTINAGQFFLVPNANYQGTAGFRNMYIRTSAPAYVYQALAATTNTANNAGGLVLIPPFNCFLPDSIDLIPSVDSIGATPYSSALLITTELGATVKINGIPLIGAEPVLGVPWETYKTNTITGNVKITSTAGVTVSVLGVTDPAGFAGYFSGFSTTPIASNFTFSDTCFNSNTVFNAAFDTEFLPDSITWDFGDPASGINNTSNIDSTTHNFTTPGTYTVQLVVHRCQNDTVTKTVTILPAATSTDVITSCTPITWIDGMNYAANTTTPTFTIVGGAVSGCDSVVTLNLTVIPVATSAANATICQGQSILLGGALQTTAGNYNDTIFGGSSLGCDSVITTTLTVIPVATSAANATICQGQSILLGGALQTTAGNYNDTIFGGSSLGCDSVIITTLTVIPVATSAANATICQGQSILLGGALQTTAGNYNDTIFGGSSLGCDSVITTTLSVTPNSTFTQNPIICQGQNFILPGGIVVNTTGTFIDTLQNAAASGCDSIVTTNLTVSPAAIFNQNFVECQGFSITVGSNIYNTTGIFIDTLIAISGCDSVVTTNLTITIPTKTTNVLNECQGFSITVGTNTYTTTGIFTDVVNSCDTIVTKLTINPAPQLTLIKADDNCGETIGSVTAIATSNNPPITYTWNTGSTDSVISNLPPGTYSVIVNDGSGCAQADTVNLADLQIDCDFFVYTPNMFSPNGDGSNDIFFVNGKGITGLNVKIYNRWGNKVFEINNINESWDGKYKGSDQNTAVFVYVLEATFLNGKTVTESGNVNLIR